MQRLQTLISVSLVYIYRLTGSMLGVILADLFDSVNRSIAVAIWSASTFISPVAGPIVGGCITISHLGWRWMEFITVIMTFFLGVVGLFTIPETFEPTLLKRRARKLRLETKNWALPAPAEEHELSWRQINHTYLFRPFVMLAQEPILTLITLYMGLSTRLCTFV